MNVNIKPFGDLYKANLRDANLYKATLHDANLRDADLYGANLYGVNLYKANLHGVVSIIFAGYANTWLSFGYKYKGKLMVRIGCRTFEIEKGRRYWRGKPHRREVLSVLSHIKKVAKLRGWIK
jgi:hypothetical protein